MSLAHAQRDDAVALRAVVVSETAIFLVAAVLHAGVGQALFGEPPLRAAMLVEGLCGIGFAIVTYALFSGQRWTRSVALAVHGFALLGVLVGISVLVIGYAPRTPLNVTLHAVMLPLVIIGGILWMRAQPSVGENQ